MGLRIVVTSAFAWLPLLILSVIDGRAVGNETAIPFLREIESHVRFLVALPLLIAAESLVQNILSPRIPHFVERDIIRQKDLPKFREAISSAHKMRDSAAVEVLLILLVYTLGIWFYSSQLALSSASVWYAEPGVSRWNLTLAGYWLVFVSVPLFQFLFLRWYYRIFIWFVFLWRVSRLDLSLVATHSDRTAGIGFLNKCAHAFSLFLLGQGALLSGYIAGQVIHNRLDIQNFKLEAAALIVLHMIVGFGPLMVFAPKLLKAKLEGSLVYGKLASRYVGGFESKWIDGDPNREDLLGTSDIQSLADISNSYTVLEQMKIVPFGTYDVLFMIALTLLPLLPFLLFMFSFEELLKKLLAILM